MKRLPQRSMVRLLSCVMPLAALSACGADAAQQPSADPSTPAQSPSSARADGYLLISPLKDNSTYILDGKNRVVHQWDSEKPPGNSVYLLDDGALLRCVREGDNPVFKGGGEGGRLQRLSWDGELEWDFLWSDETHLAHHDVAPLPNGNVLMLTWTLKSREEALAAGMDPALIQGDAIWPDSVIEVQPIEPDGGRVVWTWNVWDHLVQEHDSSRDNYGVVEEHPELIDINAHRHRQQQSEDEQKAELAHLAAIGYAGDVESEDVVVAPGSDPRVGGAGPLAADEPGTGPGPSDAPQPGGRRGGGRGEDLCHTNSIDYNPELDQIVLSVRTFSELWIIDHSTTTAEAAGHTGGRSGKGGDLLYRWGNPINYGRGVATDQRLFQQHDARWIPRGLPGAGHLTIFNNGSGRPDGDYSSVVEIVPPIQADGRYRMEEGEPFGPRNASWEYVAKLPETFYSSFISGAERQANGNTLICSGESGLVFEVNSIGEVVWQYANEFGDAQDGPGSEAGRGPSGPPPGGPPHGPPPGGPPTGRTRPADHPAHLERGPDPEHPPRPRSGGQGRRGGGVKSKSLFRASRIPPDHPGLARNRD